MRLLRWICANGEHGQCDARCYNGKHKCIHCICKGSNHGLGLSKAIENTREHWQEWIPQDNVECFISPVVLYVQGELPYTEKIQIVGAMTPELFTPIEHIKPTPTTTKEHYIQKGLWNQP